VFSSETVSVRLQKTLSCVSVVRLGIQFINNCGRMANYRGAEGPSDRLPLLLAPETNALKKRQISANFRIRTHISLLKN